jgi:hypothetical protein
MAMDAVQPDLPRDLTLGQLLQWIIDRGIAKSEESSDSRKGQKAKRAVRAARTQPAFAAHLGHKCDRHLRRWLNDEVPISAVHFESLTMYWE